MVEKQILDNISLSEFKYEYVIVQKGSYKGKLYHIEDLIKNFDSRFNIEDDYRPVSINYQIRSFQENLPLENDHLVYGKFQEKDSDGAVVELGEILHLSELLNENNELIKFVEEDIEENESKDLEKDKDENIHSISSLILKLLGKNK